MRVPDLRLYDFEFQLLHVENHVVSANWKVCYNDIGTFEAHFDLQSEVVPLVMEQEYLIVVQGQQAAIVVGKRLGGDLTVYGRTCNWLLTKRVTDAFEKVQKPAEQVVTDAVQAAFADVPVTIGPSVGTTPLVEAERSDKCETFSLVQETLAPVGLGHALDFDPVEKKWMFRVLQGRKDNPLVVSVANRNAYDVTMESDVLDLCTEGWYKQKTEQTEETEATEQWVKLQGDVAKSGMRRWEGLLSGGSESEAADSLSEKRRMDTVAGNTVGVTYGKEYALGDVVTVQYQAGEYKKTARKRVTGVNIWYESNNCGQQPIFEEVEENGV